jgi:diguanylate cyclase (GGDEF)-like protein
MVERVREILFSQRNSIIELRELPIGAVVHLAGVVTYIDPNGKQPWIQDETGAINVAVNLSGRDINAGDGVELTGTKANSYNVLQGLSSAELKNVTIARSRVAVQLPQPERVTLKTFPENEKAGIRVEVKAVIRQIQHGESGSEEIVLGESGQEVSATVAHLKRNLSEWLNAKVRVTAIEQSVYNNGGALVVKHLSIQSTDDISIEEPAPKAVQFQTIRTLYLAPNASQGHAVRLQGRVVMRRGADSLVLEDQFGQIACKLNEPTNLVIGRLVEVTGFPAVDGPRIDLLHSSLALLPAGSLGTYEEVRPNIATVAWIRQLTPERANQALPVQVTGVVTYQDADWRHLFLQDSTGGIYVKYAGAPDNLEQGRLVTVIGLTNAGDFAPIIIAPKFIIRDKGHLPRPIPLTGREAASGVLDSRYVEVEGVIHPMKRDEDPKHLTFDLFSSFGQIHVYTGPAFSGARYVRTLEDALVRMRGVLGTVFNSRRQLVGYQLSVGSINDIQVLQSARLDSLENKPTAISNLLRFSPDADFSHRVKVKGVVTRAATGSFYMQDETGGLEVRADASGIRLADVVEVVGYASPGGGYSPIMSDATYNVVTHNATIVPASIRGEQGLQGQYDSQLVTIDGRVLSVVDSIYGKRFVLQAGPAIFNAELDAEDTSQLKPLLEGSTIRLTGVCLTQVERDKLYLLLRQPPGSFKLLLRSPADLQVLRPASWWTLRHIVTVFGILLAVILAAIIWVAVLQSRVRNQQVALQRANEKAESIARLAEAMHEVSLRKEFSARVPVSGNDEIAQLGLGFNRMLAELEQREIAKLAAEQKLQNLALTDELTGLPNRRLLSDRLAQMLALAKREKSIVAVLYIDLDGFKLVNDSLGHPVGDVLLAEVAKRLQSRIRESDTLARIGGDEFTILIGRLQDSEVAGKVAESLLQVLAQRFMIDTHELTIGASIGISFFPENAMDGTALLQQADCAMYAAKRNGKNQIMYYNPDLGSFVRERLSLENQLHGAMTRGEILVHYQPEFDLSTGRLLRFEALARWIHPTLGRIPPDKFIPIAEESGQIIPLGAYIMEKACVEALKWQAQAPAPVQVAVNVSSLQFARPTFVEEVKQILERTGLPPSLLQIELTESVMLRGPQVVAERMQELRKFGVGLAIDDFGTGYSCLSYLPRLPFNALKIDRSFVNELATKPEVRAMIHSLITLSHNLKMQVIVEGVETNQQLELIKELGGNEVQGYLLGRPTDDPLAQIKAGNADTQKIIEPLQSSAAAHS